MATRRDLGEFSMSVHAGFMVDIDTWPSGEGFAATMMIKQHNNGGILQTRPAHYAGDSEKGFPTRAEAITSAFKWAQRWIDDALDRGLIE